MPVLEALQDERLHVDKVVIARNAHGTSVEEIRASATDRGVLVEDASPEHVTKLARNGKQHQGVVADVVSPRMDQLTSWLAGDVPDDALVLVLHGVANPANVGMILRSAVAAGADGIVLPRRGSPDLTPVVVKASAGVAFVAPVLRCTEPDEGIDLLARSAFAIVGLDAAAERSIYAPLPEGRIALVVGNETNGFDASARRRIPEWRHIPMAEGAESLNVACAATVAVFEISRRRAR